MGKSLRIRNNLRLSTRFALMVGAIVCAFCLGSALLLYAYLKEKVIQDTYQKGQIVFALMDGVGSYVSNTLRPKMFSLISSMPERDAFIVEAMSTTRIRHGVMDCVGEKKSEFLYQRVAEAPRNPANQADSFHTRMMGYFKANGERSEWHGMWGQDGKQFFFIMKPIYVKPECLKCHGNSGDAPPGLIRLYGADKGFGYHPGELMGLESISISLTPAIREIHDIAVQVSVIGFFAMFFLFIGIEGTFLRLIGKPLRQLTNRFEEIASGARNLRQEVPIHKMDEIGELTGSFNTMARHLAEAQETLESNAAVLQSIIDGISDPLALVNTDGSLSVLNQAYQSWLADSSPAVLGKKNLGAKDNTAPTGPSTLLEAVFSAAKAVSGEWTGPDERCYFMNFYPLQDEAGRVHQVVHYIRDITVHKQSENRLTQMEKMAAIGQLSAGVAHEINNPLGVILCYTKLLKRDLPSDHPVLQDVTVIDRNAQICKQIVDGLLSFSRHGTTRKEKGQLNAGLTSIVTMLEKQFRKEGIALATQLDADLPEFSFDPERMRQVYMNLLMNAKQAMPHGGTISIRTRYDREQRLAEIRIEDCGAGIAPEHLDKIFNPFFTTKKTGEGTGLGLSVSYGVIKDHGGEIAVESIPDGGSTFIIKLPVEAIDERPH